MGTSSDNKYSFITHENGTQQLLISQPSKDDSGHYTCQIESPSEQMEEISYRLNFSQQNDLVESRSRRSPEQQRVRRKTKSESEDKHPIALETFLKNMTVEEGGRAKFICSVIGPITSVEWFKDNKVLPVHSDRRYRALNEDGLNSLEIQEVNVNDSGYYTCTLSGRRNDLTTSSKLTVYESSKSKRTSDHLTNYDRPPIAAYKGTFFDFFVIRTDLHYNSYNNMCFTRSIAKHFEIS